MNHADLTGAPDQRTGRSCGQDLAQSAIQAIQSGDIGALENLIGAARGNQRGADLAGGGLANVEFSRQMQSLIDLMVRSISRLESGATPEGQDRVVEAIEKSRRAAEAVRQGNVDAASAVTDIVLGELTRRGLFV